MALQDDAFAVFHTGGGRNADDDIAGIVLDGLKAVGNAPLVKIGNYFFFVLGRTRNAGERMEILPDNLGFKIFDTHFYWF